MNEEELNLADYWRIINKRKKLVIILTLFIVLVAAIHSSIKPKLYESEAMVQLAVVGPKSLFTHAEAKNIIESSTILGPALDTLFKEEKRPSVNSFKNCLEVEIVYETMGKNKQVIPPFLKIKVKTTDPIISQKMALAATNEWMDYITKEFNIQKELIISQYNGSKDDLWDDIRLKRYFSKMEYLQEKIARTQERIGVYEKEVAELESQIRTTSFSSLSEGGIAKVSLLISILSDYKKKLTDTENSLISMEQELEQGDFNFEVRTLEIESGREEREKKFIELFLYIKEPAIIDYPEIPSGSISSSMKHDLLMGLGIGLLVSISLAFILEWSKKTR